MLYGQKEKGKKKVWKEFNKEREKKNCSINQVMRGKGITFNDIFFQPLDLLKIYWVKNV